ncbi:hypothetical protein ACTA71_009328 [Dictyostelium dimigraforme]
MTTICWFSDIGKTVYSFTQSIQNNQCNITFTIVSFAGISFRLSSGSVKITVSIETINMKLSVSEIQTDDKKVNLSHCIKKCLLGPDFSVLVSLEFIDECGNKRESWFLPVLIVVSIVFNGCCNLYYLKKKSKVRKL